MKRFLFIIIIIVIISYFQYNFINKNVDSYEILQYDNPNNKIFENMLENKVISIFTNIHLSTNFNNYDNNTKYKNIDKNNIESMRDDFAYYNIPLNIETKIDIKTSKSNEKIHLTKQTRFRTLIYQLKGKRTFYLFSPINYKYLYMNKNKTPLNFWNQDIQKYPLVSKSKYIEVIISENQMVYIPNNWIYASVSNTDSVTIFYNTESIFSKFLTL